MFDKKVYMKRADKEKQRVIIPKKFVDKFGYDFYMEVYKNKIVLKPVKEK